MAISLSDMFRKAAEIFGGCPSPSDESGFHAIQQDRQQHGQGTSAEAVQNLQTNQVGHIYISSDDGQRQSGFITARSDRVNGRPWDGDQGSSAWRDGYQAGWEQYANHQPTSIAPSFVVSSSSAAIGNFVPTLSSGSGYQSAVGCTTCGGKIKKWNEIWYCPQCGKIDGEDRTIYQYRMRCETEGRDVFAWGFEPPSRCPHNLGHSINTNTITIVATVSPEADETDVPGLPEGSRVLNLEVSDE